MTILPTGMALGVTQQLPVEERHIYNKEYIADSLVVRSAAASPRSSCSAPVDRRAERPRRRTELARKMVREWGMSDRIGPMAWGSQGAVFLGEDLVHTRDYSDETARVIDEEVERILRDEENRTRSVAHRAPPGPRAVAEALLERETLDGDEVGRLVDDAMGHKSGGPRRVAAGRRHRGDRRASAGDSAARHHRCCGVPVRTTRTPRRRVRARRGRVRGCCRGRAARPPPPRGRWR